MTQEISFKDLRESLSLTQEQCASVLDLSIDTIRRLERVEKTSPTFSKSNRRNFQILKERLSVK